MVYNEKDLQKFLCHCRRNKLNIHILRSVDACVSNLFACARRTKQSNIVYIKPLYRYSCYLISKG